MANVIIMPKQGQSVESCIITQWMKKTGESVTEGDLLFTYETDKAAFEEYAKSSGTMLAVLAEEGDDVPCLDAVCVIGSPGEDISGIIAKQSGANAAPEEAAVPKAETRAEAAPAVASAQKTALAVSPRARMAAEKFGVDSGLATPTGAEGRVIERDILALVSEKRSPKTAPTLVQKPAAEAPELSSEYTDKPMSGIRKAIARQMTASLQNTAQLTHSMHFDAGEILELRAKCKKSADEGISGITIGDMLLFAVSRALLRHESLNAHLIEGDILRVFGSVNLGFAVDSPRGLMVPTIFGADRLSLFEISKKVKELSDACKKGSINPDLLKDATFTISNLGALGVEHFTPVINPPQTGILGVCAPVDAVRQGKGGIEVYKAVNLCLTYDHRALDGAPATRFLSDVKQSLEDFTSTLML